METITAETSRGPEGPMQPQRMEQPSISKEYKQMRVLMAVDETDDSFYALNWVLENLFKHSSASGTPELKQDHLTLVHAVQIFPQYVFPGAPGWNFVVPVVPLGPLGEGVFPPTSAMGSVTKVQRENAAALLSRALQICKEKKIVADTVILEGGDPKEIICQATEEMNVDLLVVGSRGFGKIKRAFLGSVSDYCAHHAKCPVLIVKPPKESRK